MYIGGPMALHIANPNVVSKVNRLARELGLTKTAVIEQAIDELARTASSTTFPCSPPWEALLVEFDRIPDLEDSREPLLWDAHGLPA